MLEKQSDIGNLSEEDKKALVEVKEHNSLHNGVMSFIATLIQKIGLGSVFIFFNLSTYLISFLVKEKQPFLSLSHSYFLGPVLSIAMALFMPMVGTIEIKLGLKKAILVSTIVNMSGCLLLILSRNYYLDLVSIFLYSVGFSIGIIIMSKNVSMYFFSKRGTVSGLLDLISSLFNGLYNVIGERIINPKHIDVEGDSFYRYDVSRNILNFFLFQMIMFGITSLLAYFLVVPFDLEGAEKVRKIFKKQKSSAGKKVAPKNEEDKPETIEEVGHVENNPMVGNMSVLGKTFQPGERGKKIKKALKSSRVIRLFLMSLFNFPINNLIMMTWRPVGLSKRISTETIQLIGTLTFFTTSIATPLFGFLADKVQYRILYIVLAGISSVCGFLFFFSFSHSFLFGFIINTMNFIMGAFIQIGPPHFMKVFGMRYYIEISGMIGMSRAILSPICSFFAFFVEKSINNKDLAYKIIYNGSAGLNLIAIALALFETENEFDYDD